MKNNIITQQDIAHIKKVKTCGTLLKWYKRTIRDNTPLINRPYRGHTTVMCGTFHISIHYGLTEDTRVILYDRDTDKTYRTNQRITNNGRDRLIDHLMTLPQV